MLPLYCSFSFFPTSAPSIAGPLAGSPEIRSTPVTLYALSRLSASKTGIPISSSSSAASRILTRSMDAAAAEKHPAAVWLSTAAPKSSPFAI